MSVEEEEEPTDLEQQAIQDEVEGEGVAGEEEEEESVPDGTSSADGRQAADEVEEESSDGPAEDNVVTDGLYDADNVNEEAFEELHIAEDVAFEAQCAWSAYLKAVESPDAAGEALYAAMFDAAPSLQSMFKSPRAILASKILHGISAIVASLQDPKNLKVTTETLGFQHLDYETTAPRVVLYRDAIIEVIALELGPQFKNVARQGLRIMFNYVGGAYIYIRHTYAQRLKILSTSWAIANKKSAEVKGVDGEEIAEGAGGVVEEGFAATKAKLGLGCKKTAGGAGGAPPHGLGVDGSGKKSGGEGSGSHGRGRDSKNLSVPTSFVDMFRFNAAVMGFAESTWMDEVLGSFDAIVCNIANSHRLQEECDVLSLRLSKYPGHIDLGEYKAVMLAAMRSLVPKGWDSDHEVAWSWLWKNVDRILRGQMGKPTGREMSLRRLFQTWADKDKTSYFLQVYSRFFEIAPAGMDCFKQSTTRLLFVADKIFFMTLEMYEDPDELVNRLSALGLRHVGYGIPPELCGPLVCSYVDCLRKSSGDNDAVEAFEWSLSLISRVLARVIVEGSTLVMRAINANSGKQLAKAVALAPRSERSDWVLNVSVGSQSISPLLWAIETGSFDAAEAIIKDLLTIRADRDRYYYGVDPLFERHPDIIHRLCQEAPSMLPVLLDGLIWRSRVTERGQRRVVYFLKHLIVREDGELAQTIEWITRSQDPKTVCHPVISWIIDAVWNGVAARAFLWRKAWLLLTATVFMCSQAILNSGLHDSVPDNFFLRMSIFICRGFIYMVSWPSLAMVHIKRGKEDIRRNNFVRLGCIKLPGHLIEFNSMVSLCLCLTLLVMLIFCPILHCFGSPAPDGQMMMFTERCEKGDRYLEIYALASMCGMLCYWALLVDLSVFNNKVCAFSLIFGHVASEVLLFLLAMVFVIFMFSSSVAALKTDDEHLNTIHFSARSFLQMFLGMFASEEYEHLAQFPLLFSVVVVFSFITGIYMVNLLVAQLACAYSAAYEDMVGWARLKRGEVCVASMGSVSKLRWQRFVATFRFEEPCEFGEGDIGMPGAVQLTEAANANITTFDMIKRVGGSTSPGAMWPEEDTSKSDDVEDKMERMEKLIKKMMHKLDTAAGRRRGGSSNASGAPMNSGSGASGSSGHEEE